MPSDVLQQNDYIWKMDIQLFYELSQRQADRQLHNRGSSARSGSRKTIDIELLSHSLGAQVYATVSEIKLISVPVLNFLSQVQVLRHPRPLCLRARTDR